MSRKVGFGSRRSRPLIRMFVFLLAARAASFPVLAAESAGDVAARIVAARRSLPAVDFEVVRRVEVDGLTRFRVLDLRTGRLHDIALDGEGREVPAHLVEQALASRGGAAFEGKRERALVRKIESEPATATTGVVAWARTPGPPPMLAREGKLAATALAAFKQHHKSATRALLRLAERRGWTVEYQAEHAPVILLAVPNHEIELLERRADVDALYLERTYVNELSSSAAAIDAPTVWSRGITGSGVITAVVEGGAIDYNHPNLAGGSADYCNPGAGPLSTHTTGVAGIIASTHGIHRGVAHGSPVVLSGNVSSEQDSAIIACTEWAINRGARVINYSFGLLDSSDMLNGLDRYVDYVVRYRRITMVKSAGNSGNTDTFVTSPGKGWNIITVGNYNDRETAANADDLMASSSSYGDPFSKNGDREKPEVAAPGISVMSTCTPTPTSCNTPPFLSFMIPGTSFAAPHVTGCAALMMQRRPDLQSWPESIKAVLMATAVVNLEGATRLSERDGAGGIECDSADDVLRGVSGGERHGTYSLSSFPLQFPFNAVAGRTVRVVVVWDSDTGSVSPGTSPATDVLKADLNLSTITPSGSLMNLSGTSASFDNSYEIVEFTAPETGTYTAVVRADRFNGTSEHVGFAWWTGTREDN